MKKTEKKKQHPENVMFKQDEKPLMFEEPPLVYHAKRYSYADYLTWTDDVLREIIDGIVYSFASPTVKHAIAVRTLIVRACNYITKRKGKCEIFTAPFDVLLPTNGETDNNKIYNVVQPDIFVVCDLSKIESGVCIGAPDMIAEMLSPSTKKKDLGVKFNLYEKVGVKEYWVVCPNNKTVTVYILQQNNKYDAGTTYEIDRGATHVPVQTLKGLKIELKELFKDITV